MTIAAEDITVVVRECGERTADASVHLLEEMLPGTIHRASAVPFHATLRKSLELGLSEGRAWTLCIDADVLILPGLSDFLTEVEMLDGCVFEAQGLILDKLIPSRRPAGNHLYRTSLIPIALPLISTRKALRPESDLISAMGQKGFPAYQSHCLVGLHDFEQSYLDLYSKAFLHGSKHDHLMHLVEPIWRKLALLDDDYTVALAALGDAIEHEGSPVVSRAYRVQEAQDAIKRLNVSEKAAFPSVSTDDVRIILETAGEGIGPDVDAFAREIQVSIDNAMRAIADRQRDPATADIPLLRRVLSWYRRRIAAASAGK